MKTLIIIAFIFICLILLLLLFHLFKHKCRFTEHHSFTYNSEHSCFKEITYMCECGKTKTIRLSGGGGIKKGLSGDGDSDFKRIEYPWTGEN